MKDKSKTPDAPLIKSPNHFPVVGIGASAGGLDAFKKLIKAIPENSGMAFVLVQHLDPKHESMLPELLQKVTSIPVLEISDDIRVHPNHIYIIPSNKMMVANDGVLLLSPRSIIKNERNLPIDLFFSSLAEVHQSHSIGVVLSGTASDGTKGLKAIKDQGGITFAQSEESAAYDGMPHSAIQAGVVDFILAPEAIPQKLLEITKIINGNGTPEDDLPLQDAEVFKQILALLRIRKGTDFTYYKQTTIRRRILRRMALNKNEEPSAYLSYLRESKPEQDILYQDLLIPVTSFFRDVKSFENLCETVFPQILRDKKDGEPIRVWVTACSTGQEVYSIAMCLKEFLSSSLSFGEGRGEAERVQIFATDISEPAIIKARHGIYAKSDMEGISPERLQEFFSKTNGSSQVNKSIRDMCVFAVHNFLKDPPFGKMDLISCRNVLIYMEPYLQKKALTTFHYALNQKGFLLLGKSETISSVPDLFALAAKGDKLFSRKDVAGKFMHLASQRSEQGFADRNAGPKTSSDSRSGGTGRTDFQKTADDIMLSKYTPAGVVVNEEMDIVHFRGKTGNYLEQLPGKPSHNLLKMARNGLAFELRNILHKAKKSKAPVIKENIPIDINGSLHNISIEALPLPDTIEPHYLVLFHEEKGIGGRMSEVRSQKSDGKRAKSELRPPTSELRIKQLEKELAQIREDMRSITEDQEAANEELQSANEELLSGSEELQSLNEELETGKEELQSTNEELSVVNQEMVGLNEQVTEARNYAETIIATIREPLLVLDKSLRIKSANQAFYKTFQVSETETEGKLIYEIGNKQWDIAGLRNLLENILPQKSKIEDFEVTHNFPNIGERIMLLNAREMQIENGGKKLILLAVEDISEQKATEQNIKRFKYMVENASDPFILMRQDGTFAYLNKLALEKWGYTEEEARHLRVTDVDPANNEADFNALFIKAQTEKILEKQTTHKKKDGTIYPVEVNMGGLMLDGKPHLFAVARDITERKRVEQALKDSEVFSRSVLENSPDCVKIIDTEGRVQFMNTNGLCIMEIDDFGEVKNKPWAELWGKENSHLVSDAIDKAMRGEVAQFQAFCPTAKGTPKWWDVMVSPVHEAGSEQVTSLISVSRDVTEQRAVQSLLDYRKALLEANNEASVDGILLVGVKGKILSYNKRFIEIWNMPQSIVDTKDDEAALSFAMTQLTNPDQFIEKVSYLYQHPTETSTDILEFLDGRLVERHGYPVIAEDGTYYAWSWTFRDITEARKTEMSLQQSEQNFRQLAELLPDKVSHADERGYITYYNQSWLNYTGYSFEEITDLGWSKIIHPDDADEFNTLWLLSLETGDDFEMEIRLLKKTGEYLWHLTRSVAVKDEEGKIKRWMATTTEIHKIKEEGQRKSDFLKMVSHELKTPVTSIKGYVQFLLKMLSEEQEKLLHPLPLRSSLKRIDSQIGRLTRLITEMLDLSRIEESKLELQKEPFNLNDLVNEAIEDIRFSSPNHQINIHGEQRFSVSGDRDRIGQVIINFITNAIKYSPNNDMIEVRLTEAANNQVEVSVEDDGIGIDQEDQGRIFERFYRVEGRNEQRYGGFGIGLFVAAEIIKRHDGYITVESEKGKGSVFTFTLPCA